MPKDQIWLNMLTQSTVPVIRSLGQEKAESILYGKTDLKLAVINVYKEYIGRDWEEEYNVNYRLLKLGTKC